MSGLHALAEIDSLMDQWVQRVGIDHSAAALESLAKLLAQTGTRVPLSELRFAFRDIGAASGITAKTFRDRAVPLLGSVALRRAYAINYLWDGSPDLKIEDLGRHLETLGVDADKVAGIVSDLDRDGDGHIAENDVLAFLGDHEIKGGYRASHVRSERLGRDPVGCRIAPDHPSVPGAAGASDSTAAGAFSTVSLLDMQIGFFRLLQGAAYRSFRESYSAHSETHLRARDLPYTVPDFAEFIRAATDFYLALGLVQGDAARAEFQALVNMVDAEEACLADRIATWGTQPITAAMAAAEATIADARAAMADNRRLLSDALELALVMRMHGLSVAEMDPHLATRHELNRLRHAELAEEHGHHSQGSASPPASYLDVWNPVLISDDGTRPDGAIMPARFWYESFMPQLLRCASIRNDDDAVAARTPDAESLAAWHAAEVAQGSFDRYAADLRDGFAQCDTGVQQALRQAWRLTEPYLNGLEKRREREEFGRETGALSQYVSFVDVYLGRSDIADAEMRVSFPYYIGPAVWCFLHTAAERVESLSDARERAAAFAAFKRFFRSFATMYPCPYCRYHLNRYVVRNAELEFYPLEFALLGQRAEKALFDITLDDRLDTISTDRQGSLRLFIWKLHNAVSSSIARTEPWYHRETDPLYTVRFWPGLDAEIARARALGLPALPLDRLECIYGAVKPASHLAIHREAMREALADRDSARIRAIADRALRDITALEAAIETSGQLTRSYALDAGKDTALKSYSLHDEAYARSGLFVER